MHMGREPAFNYPAEEEYTLQAYNPSQFFKEYKGLLVQARPQMFIFEAWLRLKSIMLLARDNYVRLKMKFQPEICADFHDCH